MTSEDVLTFIKTLKEAGWKVVAENNKTLHLEEPIVLRYPRIPNDYLLFLGKIASCTNAAETVWVLCQADYNNISDSAFRWNEFELQSLEAADGDEFLSNQVREFWDHHLPFLISVKSEYSFMAFSLYPEEFGAIVAGCEPEYEEVTKVCDSFSDFVRLMTSALQGSSIPPIFQDFI